MAEKHSSICQLDRPSPRERRHEAILDAAETLFIEQGYDKTNLAEVVRRSGGSLGTLYDLFGNKQGLLHAIAIRWRDETMQGRVKRAASSDVSNVETLMDFVRHEIELWQSPRTVALLRMLVSEGLRDREFALQTYRDLHLPFIAEVSGLLGEWAAAGQAEIDDPDAAAHLFLSTISGDMMLCPPSAPMAQI